MHGGGALTGTQEGQGHAFTFPLRQAAFLLYAVLACTPCLQDMAGWDAGHGTLGPGQTGLWVRAGVTGDAMARQGGWGSLVFLPRLACFWPFACHACLACFAPVGLSFACSC